MNETAADEVREIHPDGTKAGKPASTMVAKVAAATTAQVAAGVYVSPLEPPHWHLQLK